MVLEKTLESPLDCKEIQPIHPKGDQPWVLVENERVWRARVEADRLLRRLLPSSRAQGDVGLTQGGG